MAAHVIKVPDIGEGIAEVELVAWHVQLGDRVAEDQALADVMTEKATVEIPSPVAGRVLALAGEVGQAITVGAELIRIEIDLGAAVAASEAPAAAAAAAPAGSASLRPVATTTVLPATEAVLAPAAVAPHAPLPSARNRPIASPALRARAWELGIDLNQVQASGSAGRITQADLDAYVARRPTGAAKPVRSALPEPRDPHAAPVAPLAPRSSTAAKPDATRAVKIVGLRRRIAQKMQESKRRIPHFVYVEEIDVTELEALRERLNARWGKQRSHLTLLPFLVRALVPALREFPSINARFDDEAGVLTEHQAVHVGIATQTDSGLMVPVLRHAQALDLWDCAAEVARLAVAARSGKVTRDELSGSTITLSSLGRLGGIASTPIINHPDVAIVGVNRIVTRPMLREGAVVARQMMNLSSSFDHRVVDGALGAAFVQRLRQGLEQPALLFVE